MTYNETAGFLRVFYKTSLAWLEVPVKLTRYDLKSA
jgi:hypothetical protein